MAEQAAGFWQQMIMIKAGQENNCTLDINRVYAVPLLHCAPLPVTAFGRDSPVTERYPVKMCHIGKSHNLADFRNALIRFHKQPLGMSTRRLLICWNNGAVGVFFKFPAQIIGLR